MLQEVKNRLKSLDTKLFSDYQILVNEVKEEVHQLQNSNIRQFKKERNASEYHSRKDEIEILSKQYNAKLTEFYNNFFNKNELIRDEISRDPKILDHINNLSIIYFYGISAGIENTIGPSEMDKERARETVFKKRYNSGYYLKSKSEGCFIATFAYESYENKNVLILRAFRDQVLESSSFGRLFIKFYYSTSPLLVLILKTLRFPKPGVKFILNPIIRYIQKKNNIN